MNAQLLRAFGMACLLLSTACGRVGLEFLPRDDGGLRDSDGVDAATLDASVGSGDGSSGIVDAGACDDPDCVTSCDHSSRNFEPGVHTDIRVPVGCTTATVRLWGGAGAAGAELHGISGGRGGAGGYAQSTLTISGAITLWIGTGGASGCNTAGSNAGEATTYAGGAGGTSTGTNGRDDAVAFGGSGDSPLSGFEGGSGHYGGGGGGGSAPSDAVNGPGSAGGGGGGAASVVWMNGTRVMVAGGGGGGGTGVLSQTQGQAGGAGGDGCSGDGRIAEGRGGGGVCSVTSVTSGTDTSTQSGSNGTPFNSGSVPSPRARGVTSNCGAGYATLTFAP